ncbi:MAG: OadG family transporter subunit [Rikenellaceae bacterium]
MKKLNFKKSALLVVALLSCFGASAQGLKNLRINEVLVFNTNGIEDAHGTRSGWIEIYNTGYTTVNLAGCFLSVAPETTNSYGDRVVDRSKFGTLTYGIPKSAKSIMSVAPQSYALFFAGGISAYGPFNTSFKLDSTGVISLWDASGKGEPLSTMKYDIAAQKEDVSILMVDGEDGVVKTEYCYEPTPGHANFVEPAVSPAEKMKERDPYGITMTITAVSVVFAALILLYLVFRTVGLYMKKRDEKALAARDVVANESADSATPAKAPSKKGDMSGEIAAAIAFAIKSYNDEVEAAEQMALTLRKVAKAYSPWSSKIHGLTQQPERRK